MPFPPDWFLLSINFTELFVTLLIYKASLSSCIGAYFLKAKLDYLRNQRLFSVGSSGTLTCQWGPRVRAGGILLTLKGHDSCPKSVPSAHIYTQNWGPILSACRQHGCKFAVWTYGSCSELLGPSGSHASMVLLPSRHAGCHGKKSRLSVKGTLTLYKLPTLSPFFRC